MLTILGIFSYLNQKREHRVPPPTFKKVLSMHKILCYQKFPQNEFELGCDFRSRGGLTFKRLAHCPEFLQFNTFPTFSAPPAQNVTAPSTTVYNQQAPASSTAQNTPVYWCHK